MLKKKVAFVSGSTKGIGLAIAKHLAEVGYTIVLNSRDKDDLVRTSKLLKQGDHKYFLGDVSIPENCLSAAKHAAKHYGLIDLLVCNVGSGKSCKPGEETYNHWNEAFQKNFFSTTNLIEAFRNQLSESKGNIVCVSSICGSQIIADAPVTYSVAKAALNHYVKGIARPLSKEGIRINAVAPGNIIFEGSVWQKKMNDDSIAVENMLAEKVPLNRLGNPDEIAHCVKFLASDESAFLTGTIICADGGQSVG